MTNGNNIANWTMTENTLRICLFKKSKIMNGNLHNLAPCAKRNVQKALRFFCIPHRVDQFCSFFVLLGVLNETPLISAEPVGDWWQDEQSERPPVHQCPGSGDLCGCRQPLQHSHLEHVQCRSRTGRTHSDSSIRLSGTAQYVFITFCAFTF